MTELIHHKNCISQLLKQEANLSFIKLSEYLSFQKI